MKDGKGGKFISSFILQAITTTNQQPNYSVWCPDMINLARVRL